MGKIIINFTEQIFFMEKSKKPINKGLSDAELSAKYDNGTNAENDFDRTLNNLIKTPSKSSTAKTKK